MESTVAAIAFLPLLIYLGFFVFVIYFLVSILNFMRQRNEYLKEIRDELKKSNRDSINADTVIWRFFSFFEILDMPK